MSPTYYTLQATWRQKLIFKMKNQRKSGKRKDSVVAVEEDEECQARPKAAKRQRLCVNLSGCDSLTEEEFERASIKLKEEFGKTKPKSKTVKRLMDATFSRRHSWITHDLPHISEVVDKFPFFHHERWVSMII